MILNTTPPPPTATQIAQSLDNDLVGDVPARVGKHQRAWQKFWMSPSQDAIAIAAAYEALQAGAVASLLSMAAMDVAILNSAAKQANVTLAVLVGASNVKYMSPPAAYTVGAVTSGQPVTITLNAGWTRVVVGTQVSLQFTDGQSGKVTQTITP